MWQELERLVKKQDSKLGKYRDKVGNLAQEYDDTAKRKPSPQPKLIRILLPMSYALLQPS